jgi:putative sterol carrier protein
MTFIEAFDLLKADFEKHDVSQIPGHYAFQFNLTGDESGTFYVEIKNGELIVRPYDYHDRDAEFTASFEIFGGLARGDIDPVKEYLTGKLRVGGSIDKALKLKEFIKQEKKAKSAV